jgi:uncharacterized protein YndB with AHSA1/START domain
MKEQSVVHNTFVIERSFAAAPEQVFAAFSDPSKKRLWFGESPNHDVEEFEMDFRPGGSELVHYRFKAASPFPGALLTNEGRYLEITPGRRLVMAGAMSLEGRCFSASLVTFELLPAEKGTQLIFTHQGAFFEGSDGPEMRQAGWKQLLGKLAEAVG